MVKDFIQLVKKLQLDYPKLKFTEGEEPGFFSWRPETGEILYASSPKLVQPRTASVAPVATGQPRFSLGLPPSETSLWTNLGEHSAAPACLFLLHELSHALLGHQNYDTDAELLRLEVEAWELVRTKLAPRYEIPYDAELADAQISSYREWLARRSLCPACDTAGWQIAGGIYKCPACAKSWRVGSSQFKNTYRTKV